MTTGVSFSPRIGRVQRSQSVLEWGGLQECHSVLGWGEYYKSVVQS